jgi:hypothetical protein
VTSGEREHSSTSIDVTAASSSGWTHPCSIPRWWYRQIWLTFIADEPSTGPAQPGHSSVPRNHCGVCSPAHSLDVSSTILSLAGHDMSALIAEIGW